MIEISRRYPLPNPHLERDLASLQQAGIDSRQIAVLSREPLPVELPASGRSRLSLLAVTGAIAGMAGALGLVAWTVYSYRLHVGGMPFFAPLPAGVITYEMTLLAAIVTTVVVFFLEAGLGPGRRVPPHPELQSGEALLSVQCRDLEQAEWVRRILVD